MQLNQTLSYYLGARDTVIQVMEFLDQEERVRMSKYILTPADWLGDQTRDETIDEAQSSEFTLTKLWCNFVSCQLFQQQRLLATRLLLGM